MLKTNLAAKIVILLLFRTKNHDFKNLFLSKKKKKIKAINSVAWPTGATHYHPGHSPL